MSMNGISGYSYGYYPQSTNAYYNPNFQGSTQETKEEKEGVNKGLIAAGVGAAVAIGTSIYAFKKGKSVNGADASVLKNLKTGFSTIGKTISKTAGEVLDNVKDTISKIGKKDSTSEIGKAAENVQNLRVGNSSEYIEKTLTKYEEAAIKPYQDILANMAKENGTEINLYRILK